MSLWLPNGKLSDGTLLQGPFAKEYPGDSPQIKLSIDGRPWWVRHSGKDLSDTQKAEIHAWAEKRVDEYEKKIFRLTPIDPTNENWLCTIHKAEAVVRAWDEQTARNVMKREFGICAPPRASLNTIYCPWGRAEHSHCVEITDGTYPAKGPEGVLFPREGDR